MPDSRMRGASVFDGIREALASRPPPENDPPRRTSASDRARRVPIVSVAAGGILVATIVVGAVVYDRMVLSYRPLAWAGGGVHFQGEGLASDAGGGPSDPTTAYVPLTRAGEVRISFELANEGPRGVKVVELTPPRIFRAKDVDVDMGRSELFAPDSRDLIPFHPFTLGGRERRMISLVWHFADCDFTGNEVSKAQGGGVVTGPGGTIDILTHYRVEYEVWGVDRATSLPLPSEIALVGAPTEDGSPGCARTPDAGWMEAEKER